MAKGWTPKMIKEHFEILLKEKDRYTEGILAEKDKALAAALIAVKEENRKSEIAAEKRFDLLNELRSGVATKDEVKALEKVVEELKTSRDIGSGKSAGYSQFIGWIAFAITFIGFLIMVYSKIKS